MAPTDPPASGVPGVDRPIADTLAAAIVALRGHPVFIWREDESAPGRDTIDDSCLFRMLEEFRDVAPVNHLDVLLHSSGGDAHAAYRCLRVLRRQARRVTLLVPYWAKSAATLLTLGAEEVLIGRDGELGPLDAQLQDPRGSIRPLSALEEFKALQSVRDFALESLDDFVVQLYARSRMDIPYALDRAQASIRDFTTPLYSQVRPQDLGRYRRSLAVAEEYAKRAMQRWGYPDLTPKKVSDIIHALVWDYPAHEFVIDAEEAKELGLNVSTMPPEVDALTTQFVDLMLPMFKLVGASKVPLSAGGAAGIVVAPNKDQVPQEFGEGEQADGQDSSLRTASRHGNKPTSEQSTNGAGASSEAASALRPELS